MTTFDGLLYKTSTTNDGNMSFQFDENSVVIQHRENFLYSLHLAYTECVVMACDHGEKIICVHKDTPTGAQTQAGMPSAEALLTNIKGVSLMLLTADCVPAIFYDVPNTAIALAHLNRKTISHHLAKKVIQKMTEEFDTDPHKLMVWFEPHIHASSYSFTPPLNEAAPELEKYMYEKDGKIHVDFARAHVYQIIESGVKENNITVSNIDVGLSDSYYSHTKSKTDSSRPQGRYATLATLKLFTLGGLTCVGATTHAEVQ